MQCDYIEGSSAFKASAFQQTVLRQLIKHLSQKYFVSTYAIK